MSVSGPDRLLANSLHSNLKQQEVKEKIEMFKLRVTSSANNALSEDVKNIEQDFDNSKKELETRLNAIGQHYEWQSKAIEEERKQIKVPSDNFPAYRKLLEMRWRVNDALYKEKIHAHKEFATIQEKIVDEIDNVENKMEDTALLNKIDTAEEKLYTE